MLPLNSIKAFRYIGTYKQAGFTDNEKQWKWVAGEQKSLTAQTKISEFELESDILMSFPANVMPIPLSPVWGTVFTIRRALTLWVNGS